MILDLFPKSYQRVSNFCREWFLLHFLTPKSGRKDFGQQKVDKDKHSRKNSNFAKQSLPGWQRNLKN
jgi:hypothetical protein